MIKNLVKLGNIGAKVNGSECHRIIPKSAYHIVKCRRERSFRIHSELFIACHKKGDSSILFTEIAINDMSLRIVSLLCPRKASMNGSFEYI